MGNHDNGIIFFQLRCQFLNLGSGDWVQRAGRLIHQQNLRLYSQRTRDAKSLLLTTGKAQSALVQAILDLVPDSGAFQRIFYNLIQLYLGADALQLGAVSNVVVDGHWERVWFLEHHADFFSQPGGVNLRRIDVLIFIEDFALDADTLDQVVHAVECL